ncbi:MAG: hypothetical protein LBD06_07175 [Candidatus Accumulibacter sp.]|jgi:hypothetical protein|nr:hypothetical protein [Accumulibacter sp.]
MAISYYQMTGALTLEQVTPVITALFDGLHLEADALVKGRALISLKVGEYYPRWEKIVAELSRLAVDLGVLPRATEQTADLETVLSVLAAHFQVEQDVQGRIEQALFADCADLDSLFALATRFDDGHRLTAIETNTSWFYTVPRLFRFDAELSFLSGNVRLFEQSHRIRAVACALDAALQKGDVAEASRLVAQETMRLLDCIQDRRIRAAVRRHFVGRLAEFPAGSDIPF